MIYFHFLWVSRENRSFSDQTLLHHFLLLAAQLQLAEHASARPGLRRLVNSFFTRQIHLRQLHDIA